MRQRTIEAKLRAICTSLVDQLANPVLERVEEWKRNTENIDKERTRGTFVSPLPPSSPPFCCSCYCALLKCRLSSAFVVKINSAG